MMATNMCFKILTTLSPKEVAEKIIISLQTHRQHTYTYNIEMTLPTISKESSHARPSTFVSIY